MPITSTPLRYPGGKSQLRPLVRALLQYGVEGYNTYVEPYCGGAGIAVDLLLKDDVGSIVINDADPAIYSFWYAVLNESKRLVADVSNVELSVNVWASQREIYRSYMNGPERFSGYSYELAFATFYLNRTNVSGIIEGGCIGGIGQAGKLKLDARFNRRTLIDKINAISARADSISLHGVDGAALLMWLESGSLNADPTRSFTFIDPPYVGQGGNLYLNSLSEDDHRNLKDVISSLEKQSWMLTYDNCDLVRSLYSEMKYRHLSVRYSSNRRVVAKEVVVLSEGLRSFRDPRIVDSG